MFVTQSCHSVLEKGWEKRNLNEDWKGRNETGRQFLEIGDQVCTLA